MDEREKQFDENLRELARIVQRPADATDQQVHRWVNLTKAAKPRRALRLAGIWAKPAVHRWALTAAAVAMLAVGLFLAYQTTPQSVSADEVFQQVGATLNAQPILHLTVKNVVLRNQCLNFEFMGADEGQAMFASMDAKSIDSDSNNIDITIARDGEDGWVHVRHLQWDDVNPMGHMIPADGALLVDVPVSRSTDQAVRQFFPMAVRPQEIQALIESLRQAVPDLNVQKQSDGLVVLEGEITRPEDLNLQMLCQTTDTTRMIADLSPSMMSGMTKKDLKKIVRTLKKTLSESMSKEDFESVSQRLDLVSLVAMQQLQAEATEPTEESQARFDEDLRTLLSGSTISIVYDPASKRLLRVNMDNVGTEHGTIRLQFDEPDINRYQLRRDRFAGQPNVKTMTRDELIYAMLLPMLQPAKQLDGQMAP